MRRKSLFRSSVPLDGLLTGDDGFVLIEGVLREPEWVQEAARQTLMKPDGRELNGQVRRYSLCYPIPDSSTPTSRIFRASGQKPKSR